jgi:proteic killer suppression protein
VTNRHYVHKRPIKPPFPADIGEAPPFFYAEDYHPQYLAQNPGGYCGRGGGVPFTAGARTVRPGLVTLAVTSYGKHTHASVAIKTWACEDTRAIFEGESPGLVPKTVLKRANVKLSVLNAAMTLGDLRVPPGNRLEKLSGNREGQHSIRINDQYRVCFTWRDGDTYDVEIVDYH